MQLKITILILLTILILTRIIHIYEYYRKIDDNQSISLYLTIKEYPKTCWFSTEGFLFQLMDCTQYPLASRLQIIGKRSGVIANSNTQTILLETEHIITVNSHNNLILYSTQKAQEFLFSLRLKIYSRLAQYLPEPLFGLFFSLIFGGNSHLDPETKQIITQIGVQHLIAASGMQVSLLVELAAKITFNLRKKLRIPLLFLVIVTYIHLAGLSISVVRAGLMHSLRLVSQMYLKQYSIFWSLSVVAAFFLLIWPKFFFEAGFQLSFLAVLGIVVSFSHTQPNRSQLQRLESGDLTDQLQQESVSNTWTQSCLDYIKSCLQLTLVVNLWIWPVLWYHFGELNLFGFVSSLALIWLLLPIFIFGWLLLTVILILPVGQYAFVIENFFLPPVYWLMWLFEWIFEFLAKFNDWTVLLGKWSWQLTLSWYGFLIVMIFIKNRVKAQE